MYYIPKWPFLTEADVCSGPLGQSAQGPVARRGGHPTPRDRREQSGPPEALQKGSDELQTDQARECGPLHGGLHGSTPPSHHHQVWAGTSNTPRKMVLNPKSMFLIFKSIFFFSLPTVSVKGGHCIQLLETLKTLWILIRRDKSLRRL